MFYVLCDSLSLSLSLRSAPRLDTPCVSMLLRRGRIRVYHAGTRGVPLCISRYMHGSIEAYRRRYSPSFAVDNIRTDKGTQACSPKGSSSPVAGERERFPNTKRARAKTGSSPSCTSHEKRVSLSRYIPSIDTWRDGDDRCVATPGETIFSL